VKKLSLLLLSCALVACGGSSESSSKAKEPVNLAPVITGSPTTELFIYEDYAFLPSISDSDGDTLSVSVTNLPAWASFDANTGEINGKPELNDAGDYLDVIVSVSDGMVTSELSKFNITVKNRVIFEVQDQNLSTNEDEALSIDITVQTVFEDSLPISHSIRKSPANGIVVGQYPNLIYTSNENFNGDDSLSYVIQQAGLVSQEVEVNIGINSVNDMPDIWGTPDTTVQAGALYSFKVNAKDVDNGLTFSIINKPDWAIFTSDYFEAELTGKPPYVDQITNFEDIIIQVTDGELTAEISSFNISVTPNPWKEKANMPDISGLMSTTSNESSLYVSGHPGRITSGMTCANESGASPKVYEYVANTQQWLLLSSPTEARYNHTSYFMNDKLYLMGGTLYCAGSYLDSGRISSVEVYDLNSESWQQAASLEHIGTPNVALCGYYNNIYAFDNNESQNNHIDVYDTQSDMWTTKSQFPFTEEVKFCETVNDSIYVITYNQEAQKYRYEIYQPITDIWVIGGDVPFEYKSSENKIEGSAFIGDYLYLMGSEVTLQFTPEEATWAEKSKNDLIYTDYQNGTPRKIADYSVVEWGEKILTLGGRYNASSGNWVYVYDPALDD